MELRYPDPTHGTDRGIKVHKMTKKKRVRRYVLGMGGLTTVYIKNFWPIRDDLIGINIEEIHSLNVEYCSGKKGKLIFEIYD